MTPEELLQAQTEPLELQERRIALMEQVSTHLTRIPRPVTLEALILIRAHEAGGLGRAPVALYQRAVTEAVQALREHYRQEFA